MSQHCLNRIDQLSLDKPDGKRRKDDDEPENHCRRLNGVNQKICHIPVQGYIDAHISSGPSFTILYRRIGRHKPAILIMGYNRRDLTTSQQITAIFQQTRIYRYYGRNGICRHGRCVEVKNHMGTIGLDLIHVNKGHTRNIIKKITQIISRLRIAIRVAA